MKKLEKAAQDVWSANGLEAKKLAITKLIDQFDHAGQAQSLLTQASDMSEVQLDKLAANLMLRDTDRVICK